MDIYTQIIEDEWMHWMTEWIPEHAYLATHIWCWFFSGAFIEGTHYLHPHIPTPCTPTPCTPTPKPDLYWYEKSEMDKRDI
jgi:hypothetical protein